MYVHMLILYFYIMHVKAEAMEETEKIQQAMMARQMQERERHETRHTKARLRRAGGGLKDSIILFFF